MKTEIEVKLRIRDPDEFVARLQGLGARLTSSRMFEDNQLYDFPGRTLQSRGAMLRLRLLDRRALLTYKEGARIEDGAKVRDEIEVGVDDGPALAAIIDKVGLTPLFRYQKYRTAYAHGDLHITLDETPIGIFAELEGPKAQIDAAARRLGFAPPDYIVESYRDLYLASLHEPAEGSGAMVFPT